MIQIFHNLTEEEQEMLKNAIPQITILIAGADGDIDAKERAWAEKITGIRAYKEPKEYNSFYTEVKRNFQAKLEAIFKALPSDAKERGKVLSQDLAKLNPILGKLSPKTGAHLYAEFKKFASHVAKSSGGFLGFFTVDSEEAKFINLPMLTPIVYDEETDEEE